VLVLKTVEVDLLVSKVVVVLVLNTVLVLLLVSNVVVVLVLVLKVVVVFLLVLKVVVVDLLVAVDLEVLTVVLLLVAVFQKSILFHNHFIKLDFIEDNYQSLLHSLLILCLMLQQNKLILLFCLPLCQMI